MVTGIFRLAGVEAVLGAHAGAVRCSQHPDFCDWQCKAQVRACIFDAVAHKRAFTALWMGNMYDGVGHQFALVGDGAGSSYRVEWLDYVLLSGYDGRSPSRSPSASHAAIVSRHCQALVDCARDSGAAACHGPNELYGESGLELACAAAGERTVCEESFAP